MSESHPWGALLMSYHWAGVCGAQLSKSTKAGAAFYCFIRKLETWASQPAEQQAKSIFTSVGLDFVSSGPSDYTVNFTRGPASNTNILGSEPYFLWFNFTPSVYVNNIDVRYAFYPPSIVNSILGTVTAHELVHRITGSPDLSYNPANPFDLMSMNHNANYDNYNIQGLFQLTPNEAQALAADCAKKHGN